jgi:hypothetical protein
MLEAALVSMLRRGKLNRHRLAPIEKMPIEEILWLIKYADLLPVFTYRSPTPDSSLISSGSESIVFSSRDASRRPHIFQGQQHIHFRD